MNALMFLLLPVFAAANIFGGNNIRAVPESSPLIQEKARAVAILVPKTFITERADGRRDLFTAPLSENAGLCSNELWASVHSLAVSCTGFLIAPDLMVTAGHCMTNFGRAENAKTPHCTDFTWLFDFNEDSAGQPVTTGLAADRFYDCDHIITAVHDSVPDRQTGGIDFREDYALVRLKRPVLDRAFLVTTSRRPSREESLTLIGYPLGGPQKISSGQVLSREKNYDRVNIDAFPGNSGSPVLDAQGQVVGLLVRGYPDSTWIEPGGTCRRINHCDELALRCEAKSDTAVLPGEHLFPAFFLGALHPSR